MRPSGVKTPAHERLDGHNMSVEIAEIHVPNMVMCAVTLSYRQGLWDRSLDTNQYAATL
jgi:hypothetical protein